MTRPALNLDLGISLGAGLPTVSDRESRLFPRNPNPNPPQYHKRNALLHIVTSLAASWYSTTTTISKSIQEITVDDGINHLFKAGAPRSLSRPRKVELGSFNSVHDPVPGFDSRCPEGAIFTS
jgi:hypothetical protein